MLKMRFQCHVKISSDYMIYKVNLNPRIYDYTISWGKKKSHLCSPMCDMDPWPGPQETQFTKKKREVVRF